MKIIYTDGIFDLFHRGHIEYIKHCKELFEDVFLIVGVVNDTDAASYKRAPIYCENDRYAIVENIKFVDKIVKDAPLIIDENFMNEHQIDYVIHSFSNEADAEKQQEFFKVPIMLNKFIKINYYSSISTTDIINKIKVM